MESKLVAAHLKTLTDRKIVETIATDKRNNLYRIDERFFNMWLIVTQGNPDQKRKSRWMSEFLETWYTLPELQDSAGIGINHKGCFARDKIRTGNICKIIPLFIIQTNSYQQCKAVHWSSMFLV
ncbi:hypothetical protein FACS189446_2590 [Bacteroidia bacterium]|nr:hypothetical protein FACS189446_2590 [Bacteroidia bacterium]